MSYTIEILVSPETAAKNTLLRTEIARELGIEASLITHIHKTRQSIDARRQPIRIRLVAEVYSRAGGSYTSATTGIQDASAGCTPRYYCRFWPGRYVCCLALP